MKERHRQKAIIGVSGWFTVLVGFLAIGLFTKPPTENEPGLSEKTMITLFWGSIVVQSILFFWGGHTIL